MSRADQLLLIGYLEKALAEKVEGGYELSFLTDADVRLFRAKLYELRKGDPRFSVLSFSQHGPVLWIVKRGEASDAGISDPFD